MSKKVVVEIRGGVVSSVYTDDADHAVIIDWDIKYVEGINGAFVIKCSPKSEMSSEIMEELEENNIEV